MTSPEKRETLFTDRLERLGEGPWLTESDRIEWRSQGFVCLVHRNMPMGFWCGYVGVEPGHPWHGRSYSDLEDTVDVHGCLTYSDACSGHICHVPEPGEPEHLWWLGFDLGHAFDLQPGMEQKYRGRMMSFGAVYRDEAYVRAQVEGLAAQARQAMEGGRS
jgi:hypothetical protein